MATDKPRFSVTFTEDSFNKIKKFQKDNNISTQSKAVACLVELAISEIELESRTKKSPDAASAASQEDNELCKMLFANFNQLNREGREKLLDLSDDMLASGKYIKRL